HHQQSLVPRGIADRLQSCDRSWAAQAHADDMHLVLDTPIDSGDDPAELPAAVLVEYLGRVEGSLRRNAHHAVAVDGRGDRSSAVCTMAVVVHRRWYAGNEARAADVVGFQVRVIEVDTRIDDTHTDALAHRIPPGRGCLDLGHTNRNGFRQHRRLIFH